MRKISLTSFSAYALFVSAFFVFPWLIYSGQNSMLIVAIAQAYGTIGAVLGSVLTSKKQIDQLIEEREYRDRKDDEQRRQLDDACVGAIRLIANPVYEVVNSWSRSVTEGKEILSGTDSWFERDCEEVSAELQGNRHALTPDPLSAFRMVQALRLIKEAKLKFVEVRSHAELEKYQPMGPSNLNSQWISDWLAEFDTILPSRSGSHQSAGH